VDELEAEAERELELAPRRRQVAKVDEREAEEDARVKALADRLRPPWLDPTVRTRFVEPGSMRERPKAQSE
jgi:hypothetical protein